MVSQWPRFSTSDDLVKIGLVCVEWTPPAKTSEESLLFVGVRRSNEIAGRELKHEVALGVGAAALLSAVPGLGVLEVVVGLLQIAWFLWFGISTARIGSKESHEVQVCLFRETLHTTLHIKQELPR